MSIQLRFILTYISIVFVFIILLFLSGFLIFFSITGDADFVRKLYSHSYEYKLLTPEEENAFLDLKLLSEKKPEQLLRPKTVKKYEFENIDIVIQKNTEIVYASESVKGENLRKYLPKHQKSKGNHSYQQDMLRIGKQYFTYINLDFPFSNQEKGSIYVLRKISPYVGIINRIFPFLIFLLLILVIVIIGFLNYLVSRSIIKPIRELKEAAEKIKQGDLHFEISANSKDEIGELTQAFEEMRQKLKSSVELQIQYEDNRKQLLSSISHDLRTPITSIVGYVEGIQDGVANTPDKLSKYLLTISTKAKDMNALIDELFLFSKLDLDEIPFVFKKLNISAFMKSYVQELQFEMSEHDIDVLFSDNSLTTLYAKADAEQLRRVLINLTTNSIKFMDKERKRIDIVLSATESELIIEVKDNGSGISLEALAHIFDRFYRAEQSRNSNTGGSGLGLAIAKQIVERHGGDIWALSKLGEGTSIFFSLQKMNENGDTHEEDIVN
ncbi:HAMP domain-containing histidine kinase [Priestia aryabhattai]|uniref:sensor histidine kinase n=1 Tax=Priestia aryabhattai TaxID=412384 RepID=UPI001C0DB83A|nr:HAMP domain-containing sensor histidine kinase [Priestia aryabhattai]MBU3569091.1 HAMP domain-containing histidine kinase [Priestia aryabhattai]